MTIGNDAQYYNSAKENRLLPTFLIWWWFKVFAKTSSSSSHNSINYSPTNQLQHFILVAFFASFFFLDSKLSSQSWSNS